MRHLLATLGMTLLVATSAFGSPTIASGFPKTATTGSATSVTTATFNVAANQLLIVCAGSFDTAISVTSVGGTGGTVTWTSINAQLNAGEASVWVGTPNASITGLAVRASFASTTDGAIAAYALDNALFTLGGNNGTNSGTGAATINVTTSGTGSLMIGCAEQGTDATSWTVNSDMTADLNFPDATGGNSFLSMHRTAATSGPGAVTVGTSAPTGKQWAIAAVEVKAGAIPPSIDPTAGNTVLGHGRRRLR
jgi:hypothetical protein